jgi:hypothetical protein
VRETGARNIPEQGGGMGRGYFQIDLGAHPKVTEAQAYDPSFARQFRGSPVGFEHGLPSQQISEF